MQLVPRVRRRGIAEQCLCPQRAKRLWGLATVKTQCVNTRQLHSSVQPCLGLDAFVTLAAAWGAGTGATSAVVDCGASAVGCSVSAPRALAITSACTSVTASAFSTTIEEGAAALGLGGTTTAGTCADTSAGTTTTTAGTSAGTSAGGWAAAPLEAEALAALEAMGFPAERVRAALAADPHGPGSVGATDRAVEWLLEHPEEEGRRPVVNNLLS